MINNETYLALKKSNPKWVPSKVEKVDGHANYGASSGSAKVGIQKMKEGSLRGLEERVDPIDGILQELRSSSTNAQKNKTTRSFIKGFVDNGVFDAGNIKVVKSESTEKGGSVKDFALDDGKSIAFYTNGERYELVVADKQLYEAVLDLKNNANPNWTKYAGPIMGMWRKKWTSLNPEFIAKNAVRDVGFGYLRLEALGVKGVSPVKWGKEVSKVTTTAKLLKDINNNVDIENTQDGKYFKEMMENGGVAIYSDWIDSVSKVDDGGKIEWLQETLDSISNNKSMLNPIKHLNRMHDAISGLADVVEINTRFAAYRLAREQGMDVVDASHVSRELTIDFNKGGKISPIINSMFMFSNVGMQGADTFVNTMAHSRKAQYTMASFMAGSALIAMMNELIDDEGTDLIKEHDKMKNIVIMNPFSDKSGDYFNIPIPQGPDVFYYASGVGMDYAKGKIKGVDALKKISLRSFDFASPIQGGHPAAVVTPTVGRPFMEYFVNEGFEGRTFYNEGFGKDKVDTPNYTKGRKSTEEGYHKIAEMLNNINGDSYTSGSLNMRPETIPYFMKSYMGTTGGWIDKGYRYWGAVSKEDTSPIEQTAKFLGSGFYSDGVERKRMLMQSIEKRRYSGLTKGYTAEDIELGIEHAKTLLQDYKLTPKEEKKIQTDLKLLIEEWSIKKNNIKETLKNKGLENLTAKEMLKTLN